MATPERSKEGRRLHRAALAEGTRLARHLAKIERQIAVLRTEIRQAEISRSELRDRMGLLSLLTGHEIPTAQHLEIVAPSESDDRDQQNWPRHALRGAAIRAVAVRLLASRMDPLNAIHHSSWLALVEDAGFEIAGRDPRATFLTQVSRSPVVVRGSQPGMYRLDLDAPERLEKRLAELRAELAALHQGQQTIEAISSTRERREDLIGELARVERLVLEAVESLGLEESQAR
jgi:prefoldin subunit 5